MKILPRSVTKRFIGKWRRLLVVNLVAAWQATGVAFHSKANTNGECVILVHGLGRTSLSMKRLEWNLARAGYEVINFSYPSRQFSIEQLSEERLHRVATGPAAREAAKVHFVTHYMGGIVVRHYLKTHELENLGSVVMLAPPNQGSELADLLKRNAIGRWILGPGGCELGTSETDLPKQLQAVHFDTGIIAGNVSLNPWFSRILSGEDDGKVSVESTRVLGMNEMRVVPYSHTWMAWRLKTIHQVLAYLQNQSFSSSAVFHDE